MFSVNASAWRRPQDYPGTNFGLRSNDSHVYSVGFDYVPVDKISLGATYGYETLHGAAGVAHGEPAAGEHRSRS